MNSTQTGGGDRSAQDQPYENYGDSTTYNGGRASAFDALPEMLRTLATDVSDLVNLRIALLQAELADGVKGFLRDGAMLAAAAVMGIVTLLFVEVALALLIAGLFPFRPAFNYASGFGVVMLLNLAVAGVLVWLAMKDLKKRSLVPRRTMKEFERDKQWLTNEVV